MNTNRTALIVPPDAPGTAGAALTNDIRGIRPPVELPSEWAWLVWLAAGLAVLAAVGIWYWRRRGVPVAETAAAEPAHVRARRRLEAAWPQLHDARLFCTLVSDCIRVYLEERFLFRAPERTTEEFLIELAATDLLAPDQKQTLGEFLESCDLAKFARLEPDEAFLSGLYETALRLIDETQFDALAPEAAASEHATAPAVGTDTNVA